MRRDLIASLPLPRRMVDYLNTPHYYSEHLVDVEDSDERETLRREDNLPRNLQTQSEAEGNRTRTTSNYVLVENNT